MCDTAVSIKERCGPGAKFLVGSSHSAEDRGHYSPQRRVAAALRPQLFLGLVLLSEHHPNEVDVVLSKHGECHI